jgi:hypothetical protein
MAKVRGARGMSFVTSPVCSRPAMPLSAGMSRISDQQVVEERSQMENAHIHYRNIYDG